jgi:RNA exonuclease 1
VRELLPSDAILVGQSLNCDLNAMHLMHPYCIDTSVIFNLTGNRNRKSKLQLLAKKFLNEEIQIEKTGHSSIEDSTACLKLTKLKLSKDIYFGDIALQTRKEVINRSAVTSTGIVNSNEPSNVKAPIFSHATKRQKKTAIITTERSKFNLNKFSGQNKLEMLRENSGDDITSEELACGIKYHKESNAKKVIKKTQEVIINNDFNLSHFDIFDDLLNNTDDFDGEMDEEEKITQVIPQIDRWIQKVWSCVASNGMFMVLFCGNKNTNGVSMIQIKQ